MTCDIIERSPDWPGGIQSFCKVLFADAKGQNKYIRIFYANSVKKALGVQSSKQTNHTTCSKGN